MRRFTRFVLLSLPLLACLIAALERNAEPFVPSPPSSGFLAPLLTCVGTAFGFRMTIGRRNRKKQRAKYKAELVALHRDAERELQTLKLAYELKTEEVSMVAEQIFFEVDVMMQELFKSLDANRDNQLSREEFEKGFSLASVRYPTFSDVSGGGNKISVDDWNMFWTRVMMGI